MTKKPTYEEPIRLVHECIGEECIGGQVSKQYDRSVFGYSQLFSGLKNCRTSGRNRAHAIRAKMIAWVST
jgi:hypothetical protein